MPLFLELVRHSAARDPSLARAAIDGLVAYENADRPPVRPQRPVLHQVEGASLRDCGGRGPFTILVPSLINPPHILDLDAEVSLADALAAMGRRVLLFDWGPARKRAGLTVAGHVTQLLVPLLEAVDRNPSLIGYCLGGTMAIGAANLHPVTSVVTLATPWNFTDYPEDGRAALDQLWAHSKDAAAALGAMPMEVLQSAFWSLDPDRTVAKFAKFAGFVPGDAQANRFVALEDWANEGEPLPMPAARELIEDFFGADLTGKGEWTVDGTIMTDALQVPMLHCTASGDRITPAQTAPNGAGREIQLNSGHVGMIVGSARHQLHQALGDFLNAA